MSEEQSFVNEGTDRAALRELLADLFDECEPSLEEYQWPMESMRWHELAYCILETCGSGLSARAAARAMSELDLLDVDTLAENAPTLGAATPSSRSLLILGMLEEAGFEQGEAKRALTTLCETAETIESRFDGKIQHVLRGESDRLVKSLVSQLGLATLSKEQARETVVRWLQNVLNLPVYLERESTRVFCKEMNTEPAELVAAADDLDINVAILDELIEHWHFGFDDHVCSPECEEDHHEHEGGRGCV